MKNKKGFTLVELLIVIAIIGVLSTIAFVSLNRARSKARDAKRIADVRQLQSALELFYNDQTEPEYPMVTATRTIDSTVLSSTYVATLPTAPTPGDSSTCISGTNNDYRYTSYQDQGGLIACDAATEDCAWYRLTFCLGAQTGGVGAGLRTASPGGIQ